MEDSYLGDGVYASSDGYHIVLDLRGQDSTTRIALEPEVMKKLMEYGNPDSADITRLTNVAKLANTFFEDVLPQIGRLCIQRYDLMNDLGMELTKLMKEGKI